MNPGPASWPLFSGPCLESVAVAQHLKEFLFFPVSVFTSGSLTLLRVAARLES